jgi:uncharacterized protein YeaO (DUF488 family)
MIQLKRVHDQPERDDSFKILVNRLRPGGLSKEKADIDRWMKDIAPTSQLRKWFSHNPKKWEAFKTRYRQALQDKKDLIKEIKTLAQNQTVTLVYAAKDEKYNNARVLRDVLQKRW